MVNNGKLQKAIYTQDDSNMIKDNNDTKILDNNDTKILNNTYLIHLNKKQIDNNKEQINNNKKQIDNLYFIIFYPILTYGIYKGIYTLSKYSFKVINKHYKYYKFGKKYHEAESRN